MTYLRQTARNLTHVLGGEILLRTANLGVAVVIGRVYGAAMLGIYVSILAVATLAERIADNGLEVSGISEATRRPLDLNRLSTGLYISKTLLSVIAIAALFAFGALAGLFNGHWLVAYLLLSRTFLYSYCRMNAGLLKALDNAPVISKIQLTHSVVLLSGIAFVPLFSKNIISILIVMLAAQSVEWLLSVAALRYFGIRFARVSFRYCWELARFGAPAGLTYTLSTLMLRGDVLVLALVATASSVGVFASADSGLVMVYVVAWLFSGVLLADLARLRVGTNQTQELWQGYFAAVLVCSIPLTIVIALSAPFAIRLLYGQHFVAAALPAVIMSAAIPFIFLNAAFLSRALAQHAASTCLAVYAVAAVLSLFLNFVLGWRYQSTGVAVSIVLREAAITFAFLRLKSRFAVVSQPGPTPTEQAELAEVFNT